MEGVSINWIMANCHSIYHTFVVKLYNSYVLASVRNRTFFGKKYFSLNSMKLQIYNLHVSAQGETKNVSALEMNTRKKIFYLFSSEPCRSEVSSNSVRKRFFFRKTPDYKHWFSPKPPRYLISLLVYGAPSQIYEYHSILLEFAPHRFSVMFHLWVCQCQNL